MPFRFRVRCRAFYLQKRSAPVASRDEQMSAAAPLLLLLHLPTGRSERDVKNRPLISALSAATGCARGLYGAAVRSRDRLTLNDCSMTWAHCSGSGLCMRPRGCRRAVVVVLCWDEREIEGFSLYVWWCCSSVCWLVISDWCYWRLLCVFEGEIRTQDFFVEQCEVSVVDSDAL